MAKLACQDSLGVSKHSSCLFYSKQQSWNFSKTHVSVHLCAIFHQVPYGIPIWGRAGMFYNCHILLADPLSQVLLQFPRYFRAALAAANLSGDVVSLPEEVLRCTSAEELALPLLQMVLLLRFDADFPGTLCTTGRAKGCHYTQPLSFLFSFFRSSIHLALKDRGKANNVESMSW